MGMEDFFASLPRGKEDKPLLFGMGPLVYDFHDIDGLYYMLDRKLGGCLVMMWAKPMNGEIQGRVTLDGMPVSGCVCRFMAIMANMWILGIPLRGLVTEEGKEYQLHVEGYVDEDGNEMNPQDFIVTGAVMDAPDPANLPHERVALQAAREGIVLLKNEKNVLPVKEDTVFNLFGRGIHEFRIGAVGAGKINPRYSVNFIEAVERREGYSLNQDLVRFYGCDRDLIPPEEMLETAKGLSDTAFVLLTRAAGENQDASTEKGEYYLTDEEDALLAKVSAVFTHTVVILNVGYPIDVTFAEKYKVDGLLYLGYAGMLAGEALLDIITGVVNPSGKLPDTWAKDYYDIPASQNFYDSRDKERLTAECDVYIDTVYEEDIYVGYRYFTSFQVRPAYPFGFGLSYTNFVIEPENLKFTGTELQANIHVKNMGDRAGKEVVQLYVAKPDTEIEKAAKELVFFEKTRELQRMEEETFSVNVPAAHLTSYSEEKAAYLLEAGEYVVFVGNSAEAEECGRFRVDETSIIKQVSNLMQPDKKFVRLSARNQDSYPQGRDSGVVAGKTTFEPYAARKEYKAVFEAQKPLKKLSFADVKADLSKAAAFVAQLSDEELARLCVCASAGWGMEGIGEAGKVFKLEAYDMPNFPVSDGNSGVNLNLKNIGMPSGATIGASFNKKLASEIGRVIGEEAVSFGVPLILAPAFNIHRNPLNGRQPEYFSEDPYLAGTMAGYYSKGMESAGCGSCYKHFLGNNAESTRKRNQSVISERAIREIYFKAFEYAMEVHMPASFMTAYNAVNGVPTSADPELLLGMLEEENGFDGFIMTDWTSYDTADVAKMVAAGNCWITPGSLDNTYTDQILKGLENGTIQPERLRDNVTRLIRTMARFA